MRSIILDTNEKLKDSFFQSANNYFFCQDFEKGKSYKNLNQRFENFQEESIENHPIKRITLKELLNPESEDQNRKYNFSKLLIPNNKESREKNLIFSSTTIGAYTESIQSFSVSSCGEKVWFNHILNSNQATDFYKSKVIMYNFETKQKCIYDYEHKSSLSIVLVLESLNYVLSAGKNCHLVLNDIYSGKVVKIFKNTYFVVMSFFDLSTVFGLKISKNAAFIDLEKREKKDAELSLDYYKIKSIKSNIKGYQNNSKNKYSFIVGGYPSSIIFKILILKTQKKEGNVNKKVIKR